MNDIKLINIEGDLDISNGDFVINTNSDQQHQHDIINDAIGEWKQYLQIGLGLNKDTYSPINVNSLTSRLNRMLQLDGYKKTASKIDFNYSTDTLTISINATR